jgi:hypothetical protein
LVTNLDYCKNGCTWKAAEVNGAMNRMIIIIIMRQEKWKRFQIIIIMGVLMIGFYLDQRV